MNTQMMILKMIPLMQKPLSFISIISMGIYGRDMSPMIPSGHRPAGITIIRPGTGGGMMIITGFIQVITMAGEVCIMYTVPDTIIPGGITGIPTILTGTDIIHPLPINAGRLPIAMR